MAELILKRDRRHGSRERTTQLLLTSLQVSFSLLCLYACTLGVHQFTFNEYLSRNYATGHKNFVSVVITSMSNNKINDITYTANCISCAKSRAEKRTQFLSLNMRYKNWKHFPVTSLSGGRIWKYLRWHVHTFPYYNARHIKFHSHCHRFERVLWVATMCALPSAASIE